MARRAFLAKNSHKLLTGLGVLGGLAMLPTPASAYVGPGAGLTVIGSLVAVVAAVLIALVGLVLFPIRLALKKLRGGRGATGAADPS